MVSLFLLLLLLNSFKKTHTHTHKNRIMVSGRETESISTPKLSLSSVPPKVSPKASGMLTPPLQTTASVPFLWEEEPGKPRPCTALITLPVPTTKCLELPVPPRLQQTVCSRLISKTPSPTTVLDGPYVGKSVFSSLSFRFSGKRQDSFDSRSSKSPETVQIGALFLDRRKSGRKGKGLLGSWVQKQKILEASEKELAGEDIFVFSPSSVDALSPSDESDGSGTKVKMAKKIRRNGSFSSLSHAKSHFWAAMYEGFKHAIPWKSKKSKKEEGKSSNVFSSHAVSN